MRILILIPHPDDEVVAAAASIAAVRVQGARVFGLYLSHGCLARATLWPWQRRHYEKRITHRMDEAAAAARFLGLTPVGENRERAAREIWPNLSAVREEILNAIRACAPDVLWVPAYEGGNPDHDALNALASTLGWPVTEFAEYHFAGGRGHSNTFITPHGNETILHLDEEQKKMKRDALALYRSERGNLSALRCDQESWRPLARYDYTLPPHPGTLWHARFHWVPCRHPQVDYTDPAIIRAAIRQQLQL